MGVSRLFLQLGRATFMVILLSILKVHRSAGTDHLKLETLQRSSLLRYLSFCLVLIIQTAPTNMSTLMAKKSMKRKLEEEEACRRKKHRDPQDNSAPCNSTKTDVVPTSDSEDISNRQSRRVQFGSNLLQVIPIDGVDSESLQSYRKDIWYSVSLLFPKTENIKRVTNTSIFFLSCSDPTTAASLKIESILLGFGGRWTLKTSTGC